MTPAVLWCSKSPVLKLRWRFAVFIKRIFSCPGRTLRFRCWKSSRAGIYCAAYSGSCCARNSCFAVLFWILSISSLQIAAWGK